MRELTHDEVRARIRELAPTQRDLAERFGVSTSFVSAVLSGQKPIPAYMLESVGVRKHTVYVIKEKRK